MTKYEFLYALRDTLANVLEPSQVEEHVKYYTRYIDEQIVLGYSEGQVLSELGDPRSIAHNIIDGIEASASNYSGSNHQTETYDTGNETDTNKTSSSKFKNYAMIAAIVVIVCAVLIAVTRVIIWALPTIITVAAILWIFKKLNGR